MTDDFETKFRADFDDNWHTPVFESRVHLLLEDLKNGKRKEEFQADNCYYLRELYRKNRWRRGKAKVDLDSISEILNFNVEWAFLDDGDIYWRTQWKKNMQERNRRIDLFHSSNLYSQPSKKRIG